MKRHPHPENEQARSTQDHAWHGVFDGGPMDGAAFNLETPAHAGMRGMCLTISVGRDVSELEWHVYHLHQRWRAGAVESRFEHWGISEGGPEDVTDET
jgi:hypothetical protein